MSEKGLAAMAILSDDIEIYIKARMQKGFIELRRNELAERFHCAPSQINYVLATRFPVEKGYMVTSRRGGGGGISIRRVQINEKEYLFKMVSGGLEKEITSQQAKRILEGLVEAGILSGSQGKVAVAAVSGKALSSVRNNQNAVRANILKQILMAMLYEG